MLRKAVENGLFYNFVHSKFFVCLHGDKIYTRSYYRKESAASPQGNKGSMHNLLNKRLFI
jgi:hypothetical protein